MEFDEVTNTIDLLIALVAVGAGIGVILLLPLFFSQRRDLERLTVWMESKPEHPRQDLAKSEEILDRAETELEELTGEQPAAQTEVAPAAARVTSERPALERVTMERAALEPHPRWRQFVSRVTQPRWLATIAVVTVLVGVGAIFGSQALLETGDEGPGPNGTAANADVTVAVLNGTDVPGLGSKVGDDVEANGFTLGAVSAFGEQINDTVVLFEPGAERAANRLSTQLGAVPVQPIDRQAQRLAEGADLVVLAGRDRVSGRAGG